METVDLVLVGAEGVVESGGIINKVIQYSFVTYLVFPLFIAINLVYSVKANRFYC